MSQLLSEQELQRRSSLDALRELGSIKLPISRKPSIAIINLILKTPSGKRLALAVA